MIAFARLNQRQTLALLLTLYLAQGLPAGFITQALPAILRSYHASLVMIGWSGLVMLPWAIKFLWSPWVDTHYSARIGQARSWILPTQLLAVVLLVVVAFFEPTRLQDNAAVVQLYAVLFGLSLLGATQDVATDGLATRLLKADPNLPSRLTEPDTRHQQSQGNAVQVIGYRVGLIVGGGLLLMWLERIGWRNGFLALAGLVLLNTIPIWRYREAVRAAQVSSNLTKRPTRANFTQLWHALREQYRYFTAHRELRAWLGVLLTFKIADGISSGMVKPMMVDSGVSLADMGLWVTVLGSAASLTGAWVATLALRHIKRDTALLWFNGWQALTTGLYGLAALGFTQGWLQHFGWLYAVNALEHFCAALALIALLTTVMHYARLYHAGSDYTMQVCLLTVLSGVAHFASGYLAHRLGYTAHFGLSMLIGLACLLPIMVWRRVASFDSQVASSTLGC